jgi:GH15 family glucan-1,4-alpha-glucosidase
MWRWLKLFWETAGGPWITISDAITLTGASAILVAESFIVPYIPSSLPGKATEPPPGINKKWTDSLPVEDIYVQGVAPTEAVVGNSRMIAAFTKEGRLNYLFYPTVGSYEHVPYVTEAGREAQKRRFYGALDWNGSFAGLEINGNVSWLHDDGWQRRMAYEKQTTSLSIDYSYQETSVKETSFVLPNVPVLLRRFTVSNRSSETASYKFVYYSCFNPNQTNQTVKFQVEAELLSKNFGMVLPQELVGWRYSRNRVFSEDGAMVSWTNLDGRSFTVVSGARAISGGVLPPSRLLVGMVSPWDESGAYDGMISPLPHSGFEGSGEIQTSILMPANARMEWDLGEIPSGEERTVEIVISLGSSPEEARRNWEMTFLVPAEDYTRKIREEGSQWLSASISSAAHLSEAEKEMLIRALLTIRLLVDKETGGIIASPNLQPKYYGSWPRDGVFQAVALDLAGYTEPAERFYGWLFQHHILRRGSYWVQTYALQPPAQGANYIGLPNLLASHLTGKPEIVENDQMGTVMWGVWAFWKKNGKLPAGITTARLKAVGEYLLSIIVQPSDPVALTKANPAGTQIPGLLEASLDSYEHPGKPAIPPVVESIGISQSLYTNASAVAGLMALADILDHEKDPSAVKYRQAAGEIKKAVLTNLQDTHRGGFFTRFIPRDPYHPLKSPLKVLVSLREHDSMVIAWPFHLVDFRGKKSTREKKLALEYANAIEDYFSRMEGTPKRDIFVPQYLFQQVYRSMMGKEIHLPRDLLTTAGYVPERISLGDLSKKGGAKPLGWAEAMLIFALLAKAGVDLPLVPTPDIEEEQEEPIYSVLLVMDVSGSMGTPLGGSVGGQGSGSLRSKLDLTKEVAERLIRDLPPAVEAGLVTYSGGVWLNHGFTTARNDIVGTIRNLRPVSNTCMFQALNYSIQYARTAMKGTQGKIMLLCDGQENCQADIPPSVWPVLREINVSLDTLAVGSDADSKTLTRLSGLGGGSSYNAQKPGDLARVFSDMTSEVRLASLNPIQVSTAVFLPFILGFGLWRILSILPRTAP